VVGWKLMMIEVIPLGGMLATDIDHGDGRISEICLRGFAAHQGHAVQGSEETAGKEFVLMRAAGMSEDEGEGHQRRGQMTGGGATDLSLNPDTEVKEGIVWR
jgi:D-serine deaminase-like pyridoxal phosphate-dependent protein